VWVYIWMRSTYPIPNLMPIRPTKHGNGGCLVCPYALGDQKIIILSANSETIPHTLNLKQWKVTISPRKSLLWFHSVEQFCRGNSEFSLNPGDFHCFRFRVHFWRDSTYVYFLDLWFFLSITFTITVVTRPLRNCETQSLHSITRVTTRLVYTLD